MTHRRPIAHRAAEALPHLRLALAGAAVWAALMAASAVLRLWFDGWEGADEIAFVASVFALGGAAGFPLGVFLANLMRRRGPGSAAFAAAFLGFSVATIGATAFFYALQYRAYYAQWHGDTLSLEWMFEFVFTTAVALYQFAVLGLRLYFPLGLAALFGLSLWYAAKPR